MKRPKKPRKPAPRKASSRAPVNRLVIFVKEPRMGSVKRRLAAAIGAGEALRFYRRSLGVALNLARDPRWRTAVAVAPDRAARLRARGIATRKFEIMPQGSGDLGARMARAFARFKPQPTVVIGSDIPDIRPGMIVAAFRRLRAADAVFGPARDGGFWLVGLRSRVAAPRLFSNVRWSSAHAFSDVRRNFPRHARVAAVEMLEDVDDGASYRRWREAARRG
jgi:rSAM/selenodomain-associated transferase 1